MAGRIEEILQSIEKGTIAPCYLLYGEERFLIAGSLRMLLDALFPRGTDDLNCFRMDGERVDVETIREAILTPPLIAGRKAVVVKDTDLLASRREPPPLPENFSNILRDDPAAAARSFTSRVSALEWSLNDLEEDGWRKISGDEWDRFFAGTDVAEPADVVPALLEQCRLDGLSQRSVTGGDVDRLAAVLETGLPPQMTLILTARTVDKRKKFYKLIAGKGEVLQFTAETNESLRTSRLLEQAKQYLGERGVGADRQALTLLLDRAGSDYGDIIAAIDKILLYLGEGASRINSSDVEEMTARTRDEPLFELTNAVAVKNLERGLLALARLMERDVHPLAMLALIAREVRFLMQAKLLISAGRIPAGASSLSYPQFQKKVPPLLRDLSGGSKQGAEFLPDRHPYVIYNTVRHAEHFSWNELARFMDRLVETDVALKSSGGDPKLLMERLLVESCKEGEFIKRSGGSDS
ncbi:MAG: hypothetical protein AVO39_04225 [delta proteobacterium MLS_D]|jgi:DNA polymerase III subunit delta|nr:MAG: hypothetical protein AVO39_04225 [delta proteobacterium MLS_D]